MAMHLLTPGLDHRTVTNITDPDVVDTPGPAVVISDATVDLQGSGSPVDASSLLAGRPQAYREPGGDWVQVGYEAADHWTQLSPDLRKRLIDDSKAQLNVTEFKMATNGGSASIITNNWVYSGSPRLYRIAGPLREFTEVLAQIVPAATD